jgi:hypothetical protein
MNETRIDHCEELIHFTKNSSEWDFEKSYQVFCKIIEDKELKTSNYMRLGEIHTLCFTESPYSCLTSKKELNKKYFNRYSPFGFQFKKKYIYKNGGLPVIYSPREDFEKDNEKINWRTVSYNPNGKGSDYRDFTWEREWRIKPELNKFILNPNEVKLIFPTKEWALKFRDDHDKLHQDPICLCNCSRECEIIDYDRYFSKEEYETLSGTCPNPDKFPWILLNMNCEGIPTPK